MRITKSQLLWSIALGYFGLLLFADDYPLIQSIVLFIPAVIFALICLTSPVWGFIGLAVLWGGAIRSAERAIAADVAEELKSRGY